jgi:hypothetical protein
MTMRPHYLTLDVADEDADGFADDVTAASGAAFTLITDETPDGLAHKVVITPSGAITGNFTISGTDADGAEISEVLASDTSNAVTSLNFYVSGLVVLAPSGLGAETVDIGWADEVGSPMIPLEIYNHVGHAAAQVSATGTIGFDIEGTMEDIRASSSPPTSQDDLTWVNDANFTAKSATLAGNLSTNWRAIRLVINSYSSGAALELSVITPGG